MAGGRPRKEIDQIEFEKLCGLQCTLDEIAGWFNCSEDTIERWCKRTYQESFADVFAKNRGQGKIALRRIQFKLAEKDSRMAIFLGKNYLGQTDKREVTAVNAGQLSDLIGGLKEPAYDLYAETARADGAMEDRPASEA